MGSSMSQRTRALMGAFAFAALTQVGCGGGQQEEASSTAPGSTTGLTTVTSFTMRGSVADGDLHPAAIVTAYDSSGRECGRTTADDRGRYVLSSSCRFPVVLFADLMDTFEESTSAATIGTGRQYFSHVGRIDTDGQLFTVNISPMTSAVTVLALSRLPVVGQANSRSFLTKERTSAAAEKIKQAVGPVIAAVGAGDVDLVNGDLADGSKLRTLMEFSPISFERISSTKQLLVRFHPVTEHRPIVIVATDGRDIAEAIVDPGLGLDPSLVDVGRAVGSIATINEAKAFLGGLSPTSGVDIDRCFLHNGGLTSTELFDRSADFPPAKSSPVERVKVLRINTFTDSTNETLETRNDGAGMLVYVSYDFRNVHGMRTRAYTWLIKGEQQVGGCASTGASWRVLGNQRQILVRTSAYAFHKTTFNQQFSGRIDTYGRGTEHHAFTGVVTSQAFTHLLVNGPGLPKDGLVMLRAPANDGRDVRGLTYLVSSTSLLELRRKAIAATDSVKLQAELVETLKDTRAFAMTDSQINEISDGFMSAQNEYTYRFFETYDAMFPTLTYVDRLGKRPLQSAQAPVEYYPTIGVNLDELIAALQTAQPVDVNWSLPLDSRGRQMVPSSHAFIRISCNADKSALWPRCSKRADQHVELWDSPVFFSGANQVSITNVPSNLPEGERTTIGLVRVRFSDSLGRLVESEIGMEYTR